MRPPPEIPIGSTLAATMFPLVAAVFIYAHPECDLIYLITVSLLIWLILAFFARAEYEILNPPDHPDYDPTAPPEDCRSWETTRKWGKPSKRL